MSIEELLRKYKQSVNTGDLNLIKEIWNTDEVSFIHPNGYEHSFDDVIKHFYNGAMAGFKNRDLRLKDVKYKTFENTALVECRWDFYATNIETGEKIHNKGRESQFLVNKNGVWKITHIHYSKDID